MKHRRPPFFTPFALLFCFGIALFAAPGTTLADSKWERIDREDNITVYQHWPDSQVLPTVRGIGVINASVEDIVAVLMDAENMCDWMHACKDAKTIKTHSALDQVTYNRFDMQWPLDDRDAVVRTRVRINPERQTVTLRYRSISSSIPPEDGVVRLPSMSGFYQLKALGPNKTRVLYQGDADPGGNIPDFIIASASKDIPLEAIRKLSEQVKDTQGDYDDFIAQELEPMMKDF